MKIQPQLQAIDEEIQKKVKEKRKLKSQALAKVGKIKFDKYKIQSIEEKDGDLIVNIKGFKENPIRIVNPPIMVPDGTKRKEIIDGKEIEVDNHKEDHQETLISVLRSVLDK
jgi:hypothetical protein